jgi:hypothetical protein
MPRRKFNLNILSSHPCTQSWDGMTGTPRARHCQACDKHVHNFAAMTAGEIEKAVRDNEGHLCARIVRRADDSLVTLDAGFRAPAAAGVMLAASLAMGAPAAGQAASSPAKIETARLTGTVLLPNGSGPAVGAQIYLLLGDRTVAKATADEHGEFEVSAKPGSYDVVIARNVLVRSIIRDAALHSGEQSLQPIAVGRQVRDEVFTVTVGELVATYRYPISYLFKHPFRYLKHLPHNFG